MGGTTVAMFAKFQLDTTKSNVLVLQI